MQWCCNRYFIPMTTPHAHGLSRRQWLQSALAASGALALPSLSSTAFAVRPLPSDFLTTGKTVTLVVGGPAGGATDGVARAVAQQLSLSLGHEIIVENKAGAAGTIGSKFVSQAKNDGHTLLLGQIAPNVLAPLMQQPHPYDPVQGFTPIGQIGNTASVLVVAEAGPKTLQEAFAQWKQAGSVSYASTGMGSGAHLLGHLMAQELGAQGLHVPYRGSPFALQDLVGGRVDCMMVTAGAIGAYIDAKKLRPLAVASHHRSRFYPALPTLREVGLDSVVNEGWFGLFSSANTPTDIAQAWHAHLNHALLQPALIQQLENLVVDVAASKSQEEYAQFIRKETEHWSQVVGKLGQALKTT